MKTLLHINFSFLLFLFIQVSCNTAETNEASKSTSSTSKKNSYGVTDALSLERPVNLVADLEHILDNDTHDTIVNMIARFQDKTAYQICVVTTPTFAPYDSITAYTIALGNQWGIGIEELNNGIMFVVSTSHRQVRITPGLGMDQFLLDEQCQKIINENILPSFRQEKYSEGILNGVKGIIKALDYEIRIN